MTPLPSGVPAPYIGPVTPQGMTMVINGFRNKPFGPGGSTRRLHHSRLLGKRRTGHQAAV